MVNQSQIFKAQNQIENQTCTSKKKRNGEASETAREERTGSNWFAVHVFCYLLFNICAVWHIPCGYNQIVHVLSL